MPKKKVHAHDAVIQTEVTSICPYCDECNTEIVPYDALNGKEEVECMECSKVYIVEW